MTTAVKDSDCFTDNLKTKSSLPLTDKVSRVEEADGGGHNDSSRPAEPRQVEIEILPIEIALLRFLVVVVVGWVFFYAGMSANAKWTVETYIPWSFWLLHYLLMFGLIGGGWPVVAPLGEYGKPFWGGHGRLILGIIMTGLTVGMGAALSAFFVNVWWGYPLFPGGAWFGIGLFWMTLWFVLDLQTTPKPLLPRHSFPPVDMVVSSVVCILLAVAIFQFVNYEGPSAADSSNPEGPVSASYWFGCVVSIIVWVHNFASILTFQSWPLSLLPHPFQHVAVTCATVLLGWGIYEIVIAAGVDKGFFADAIGASQISWSLYHTVAFDFWPFHRMTQPKRGIYSFFFTQVVLTFFWIWLCRIMLQPIYDLMVEANPVYGALFTIHTMIPWFSLHVVAPLLLVHEVYFMRWPQPPGGPPLGPCDIGVVQDINNDETVASGNDKEMERLSDNPETTTLERPEEEA